MNAEAELAVQVAVSHPILLPLWQAQRVPLELGSALGRAVMAAAPSTQLLEQGPEVRKRGRKRTPYSVVYRL